MTSDQVLAARRILNPHRAAVKLDVSPAGDGESLIPYLIGAPSVRGASVSVTKETPAAQVASELLASISGIV